MCLVPSFTVFYSIMIQLSLNCFSEASKYFSKDLFASTFVIETVSSTDNKRQQEKRLQKQNFHFHPNIFSVNFPIDIS